MYAVCAYMCHAYCVHVYMDARDMCMLNACMCHIYCVHVLRACMRGCEHE